MACTEVKTALYFLKDSPCYETEKPYAFRYAVDGVPQTNMQMEIRGPVTAKDIRQLVEKPSLENHGFEVIWHESNLSYDDFYDAQRRQSYLHELEDVLKTRLGAREVLAFRHGVRKRHSDFPISTGQAYEYDQPTSVVHIDTTAPELMKEIKRQFGERAAEMSQGRCRWYNVWKPLKGPCNDWPLILCDPSSVIPDQLEYADLLYPDLLTENQQISYRSGMDWYYLSNHLPSELIVFEQADTDGLRPGVPHCSFQNPFVSPCESPRESIEARLLVFS